MNCRGARIWIVLAGIVYFTLMAVVPAGAVNNALNPFHCDFNKDGKADVLWRNTTTGEVVVWYMNGTSAPTSATVLPSVTDQTWQIAACGDLLDTGNTTGNTDIVWIQSGTNAISFWMESGTGGITLSQSCTFYPASPWKAENGADMNGKGPLDILLRNPDTAAHVIWYMNGCSGITGSGSLGVVNPASWQVNGTGDFNGDGNADLLWHNKSTGEVAIWLMNNTTIIGSAEFTLPSGWYVAQIADFNGDGKSDLLWVNSNTGEAAIWFMNGTLINSSVYLPYVLGWCAVGADDYSGNGNVDLLWWNSTTGAVDVWLMKGDDTGTITSSGTIAYVPPSTWYPVAGGGSNCGK